MGRFAFDRRFETMNLTQRRIDEFVAALQERGGSSGNGRLREVLEWEEEFYWRVQGHLIRDGRIVSGRGRGGSVTFTEGQIEETQPVNGTFKRERDLYSPLKDAIHGKWVQRFALDDVLVEETHSRGSKDTGGTFTRPDITAVGIRNYVYLPKRLEVVTFEVKAEDSLTIMGVLEAIAHREGAHRAYTIFATSIARFEAAIESERIMELAQKYGVGIVLAEQPEKVETWEIMIDAIRHEPDPSRLDRFLADLPSENMKKQLSKWKG